MASSFSSRERTLDRLKKLLARSRSSNEHEAALAKLRADEFIVKYSVTDAEVKRLFLPDATRRYAGIADQRWQEGLVWALGKKYECKVLGAKGNKVFFDGVLSVEAASEYRNISQAVEGAREEWIGTQAKVFHEIWTEVFCSAVWRAAMDVNATVSYRSMPGVSQEEVVHCARALSGSVGAHSAMGCIQRCVEEANQVGHEIGARIARGELVKGVGVSGRTFSRSGDLILVSDSRPGNYASLFLDGTKLPFRGDISAFDDVRKTYTWVFGNATQTKNGVYVIFATSNREIVGEVRGEEIHRTKKVGRIARSGDGEPLYVERVED